MSAKTWSAGGPPKSESAQWRFERRCELGQVAKDILVAAVVGSAHKQKQEDWEGEAADEWLRLARAAVDAAEALIDEVEKRRGR